jgi:hypothetical protein
MPGFELETCTMKVKRYCFCQVAKTRYKKERREGGKENETKERKERKHGFRRDHVL